MNWINVFGIIIVVLMMIPNCIYGLKNKGLKNLCENRLMNIIEQTGRYGCMLFMVFDPFSGGFGFSSPEAFIIYLFGNGALLLGYFVIWILYFRQECFPMEIALAVIPAVIFMLSGITLRSCLLIISSLIFALGHIYVTALNSRKRRNI